MIRIAIVALLAVSPASYADEDAWSTSLTKETTEVSDINRQLEKPDLTPQQSTDLNRQKQESVKKIEAVANDRPDNTKAQLAVGKSLASVDEGARAVPYAERGLSLAQASGDPKLIRQALLTGSEVYYKAGNYDLAAKRAQAVLKENPKDQDAMALYMQVKGRTSTPSVLHRSNEREKTNNPAAPSPESTPQAAPSRPVVAMTSPASLEAQRHIANGWSQISLDPAKALKSFDAAVAADAKNASVRLERAKARLQAGDARGAGEDASAAIALQPNLAEAYATRAEAGRALGAEPAALLADYEQAAKLDARFVPAYKELVARAAAGGAQTQTGSTAKPGSLAGGSATGTFNMAALDSPRSWLKLAMIMAGLALIGGIVMPLVLKRRSGEEDSQNR